MKVLGICVGKPQKVDWRGREVYTSIFKSEVHGPVKVTKDNLEGDRQADLNVHGGFDKAVYAYSADTYDWWKKKLNLESTPVGLMGENLTVDVLNEEDIFVGDTYRLGDCELQAVQPRMPCFKLGIKFGDQGIIRTFNEYHRPGVYFRVLKVGSIRTGDSFKKIGSEPIKASISELFQFIKDRGVTSPQRAAELAQIPSMNARWRAKFLEIAGTSFQD